MGSGLLAAVTLAACGGGGSDGPATPSSVTIAGTAAKGVALAGAAITIKCAAGTGTATTGADGKYAVTITGANLPCALKVVGTEGSVFHSLVAGTGASGAFVANITPLTEMVVAKAAGASPASFFDGFGSTTVVTAASLAQANDYLKTALAGVVDLTGVNPVADALAVGNPLDLKIDAVMSALAAAGVTLQTVSATIVANPAAPAVISAPLAPKASACAWLKTGKYRIVNPYERDPTLNNALVEIDAVALTASQSGQSVGLTDDGACQFSFTEADGFVNKFMVASAGMLVSYNQYPDGTQRSAGLALPEQTLPVSEFAGTWNTVGWDPASGIATPGFVAQTGEVTFDATGQITAVSDCLGLAACTSGTAPFPKFVANTTSGGFDMIENGAKNARVFLFKTLAGRAVMVFLSKDGQFIIGSRKVAIGALPAVGTVTNFREFTLNGNGTLSALLDESNTVTAIDTTANTATRLRARDSRVDTLSYNKPRDGLRYRVPNSCTVNGVASNCAGTVQLPLQGMGITLSMSVGTNPTSAFMSVSVSKPD
jgi:hypothetical protein